VETVVPLATNEPWARLLEFNGAVRATDYSTSGFVVTWKVGASYQPIEDIRFRATRSRDIRAPHLGELFASGTSNTNIVLDPFNNNQATAYQGFNVGNPDLEPEKADTTGLGVVVQPRFLPGFSASFDYFNIRNKDAIGSVGAQQIVNFCFEGNQSFCNAITRGIVNNQLAIQRIRTSPFNTTVQIARGYDIEASYRTSLDAWISGWDGELSLRALATRTLKDYSDNSINVPTESVGAGTPKWKWTASASYTVEQFRMSISGRGLSSGKLSNTAIECTSGCPTSTTQNVTTTYNRRPGNFYLDTSLSYQFMSADDGGTEMEAYLNVRNVLNTDPNPSYPGPGGSPYYSILADCGADDCQGRVFRAGIRFER
jgi:iron complex outermembrane receptor protein